MHMNLFNSVKCLIPVVAMVFLLTAGCGAKDAVEKGKEAVGEGGEAVAQLKEMLGGITGAVEEVKDEATAKSAVSKLTEMTSKLESLGIDKIPAAAKTPLIGPFKTKIEGMLETAYKLPGVEAVLKPAIEGLMSKLGG